MTIIVLVSANGHVIVAGMHNYLFHYPVHNLFAHSKHLHLLLYSTFYNKLLIQTRCCVESVKLSKEFCKSTTGVLAEALQTSKANPFSKCLSGKKKSCHYKEKSDILHLGKQH